MFESMERSDAEIGTEVDAGKEKNPAGTGGERKDQVV